MCKPSPWEYQDGQWQKQLETTPRCLCTNLPFLLHRYSATKMGDRSIRNSQGVGRGSLLEGCPLSFHLP